jgi:hypothetical protein
VSHPTKLKPHPLRNPGQNNGVRLRREPPTIAGAAATGSRRTPISRAVGVVRWRSLRGDQPRIVRRWCVGLETTP